jgi:hypothetical protein
MYATTSQHSIKINFPEDETIIEILKGSLSKHMFDTISSFERDDISKEFKIIINPHSDTYGQFVEMIPKMTSFDCVYDFNSSFIPDYTKTYEIEKLTRIRYTQFPINTLIFCEIEGIFK